MYRHKVDIKNHKSGEISRRGGGAEPPPVNLVLLSWSLFWNGLRAVSALSFSKLFKLSTKILFKKVLTRISQWVCVWPSFILHQKMCDFCQRKNLKTISSFQVYSQIRVMGLNLIAGITKNSMQPFSIFSFNSIWSNVNRWNCI